MQLLAVKLLEDNRSLAQLVGENFFTGPMMGKLQKTG